MDKLYVIKTLETNEYFDENEGKFSDALHRNYYEILEEAEITQLKHNIADISEIIEADEIEII